MLNKIKNDFVKLINEEHKEEVYQKYLEKHTQLIPREFIQNHGLHFSLVIKKLSFAKDYTSDFFYLAKSSADWNCVCIEIEKPNTKYFKKNTNDFSSDFSKGLNQINQWRAWFDNDNNKKSFTTGTVGLFRKPLEENPCSIKYVLITGRRSEFKGNENRIALIRGLERDDFKILSFDSLIEDIDQKKNLYLGVRKNQFIEIHSEKYISDSIFGWMNPTDLRITKKLKKDIKDNQRKWMISDSIKSRKKLLDRILPLIPEFTIPKKK